ncbi:GMC oxidoreductase [Acidithiobacillus ferriphilus]|jgi:choline dehydrogenase-like flavoprotein|uniref:GMC oxidoreductase n=5 Tax=Acidithiobacillus ferriphilus TaxID=1689834 RepID=UPI001C0719A6|nr:GMC family oxidoreductase [Acidithiobacillus ferriphilus]MBU2844986.1 GMC family oxidoreductase [Acidithiobacillus ferriphilus]MEB8535701.1 GMC family oxidoreductase [Acidithiobacillus ferriphilus]
MDADVIIIGSGAGGGTIARALADSGLNILILERGDYLPREWGNWDPRTVFAEHRYHTHEQWRDQHGKFFSPITGYHVGGNTKFYGAAVLRRRESDFLIRHHKDGNTRAWPICYADLAPFYDQAEAWYFTHGQAGTDPTDPPRGDYPFPPFSHEEDVALVDTALRGMGLHPFPLPLAIHRLDDDPEHSPCVRCPTCDGFPCMLHAKGDAEVCGIRPALEYSNVRLLTKHRVQRLISSADGKRVETVETDQGRFSARLVVLAAGAVNSAALLLASASEQFPTGLANHSDQVGRHYMCHLNSACMALKPGRENRTIFQKTLALNDFYEGSGDPEYPYPLGHIQSLGKVTPGLFHAEQPHLPIPATAWAASHSVDWWLTTEDLPDPTNRVTLDEDGTIRLTWNPKNRESHQRLCHKWRELLKKFGFFGVFFQAMDISATAHQVGTCRFGEDPSESVLDPFCKAHDLENLYVVDASFMPSISAVNPSLTIIANALRVGSHIRRQIKSA